MRDQEWDSTATKLNTLDLAQLVLSLLGLNAVDGEATLGVVDQAEVLASLLDGDDVHVTGGVGAVGADLAVDLDVALHQDGLGLAVVEGILETVADEDDQGHAVAVLVRTGRRLRGVDTGQFVQEPVRGGAEALLVLLAARRLAADFFRVQQREERNLDNCQVSLVFLLSSTSPMGCTHIPRAMVTDGCCVDGVEGTSCEMRNSSPNYQTHPIFS